MSGRRATVIALAGLLLAGGSATADAASLGRLFYTPEQRARLDRQDVAEPQAEVEQPREPRRVDGLVRRSGGPATVWIDGEPLRVNPRRRDDGPSLEGDRVVLRGQDGRPVRLLPGQREGRP